MSFNRVAITGIGVLSPIGNTVVETLSALDNARHGFTLGQWFADYPNDTDGKYKQEYVVANVKEFDSEKYFTKKDLRRADRITQYSVYASMEAIADSGADFKDIDPFRAGVIIGSGIGGLRTTEEQILAYHQKSPDRVSVFTIPMMIGNLTAGTVAIRTGFKGVSYTPVTACASSAHAVGEAFRNIKHGYLDVCIAGGTESAGIGFAYAAFNNMHAMSRSTDPDRASIPFDKERNGFVLAEGAATLILENYDHAVARGAKIYAEIIGYGATTDAYHETAPLPDGSGGAAAMRLAVEEGTQLSGIKTTDVNYINAHGTSTPANDKAETLAIKSAFGEYAANIAVSSTKSYSGHMLGAAGAFETAVTALQIKNGLIYPTIGYKVPDPDCDLDYVTDGIRKTQITAALSNSLGFGGHNACLCLKQV
ncbi:MAG: beta-ketoacyl-ACP synthase II [Oscillospiraceae bacterium]|jgi:3-oxoacyl-[acyl-carrier-protein] synthase II|nr:beta-ketoacyl-ACP synthase II [Oscillospiraceae bacterium]